MSKQQGCRAAGQLEMNPTLDLIVPRKSLEGKSFFPQNLYQVIHIKGQRVCCPKPERKCDCLLSTYIVRK
jgi:hypothetical protein